MTEKRISIFTGHFGSGKSEVSVNFALKLPQVKNKVALVDLDIVNPYFRAVDAKKLLSESNIKVVSPMYANTNVDVPALTPEINALFEDKSYNVVLDVGGDDLGAKALARYNEELINEGYEMYLVVNTKRQDTDTVSKIIKMAKEIEEASRLNITGLVNNTNLLKNTTIDDVVEGHVIIKEASEELGVPISFVSGFYDYLKGIEDIIGNKVLFLNKYIKLPWD
ncbi:P-loop NTPase [Acetivibrio saccincola]|jgi:Mrp family chromosome partitioning ATPase|uniref:Uncharacterized protein n=1 Tax=Acetivibrio saccincola TaxID=1677857 RepID=A0A2K9EHP3_9FIRM|nr:P-loop NTPase [Acetivibrio saccincola]AUG57463.1 hypothetical protein HVS_07760 [Acetivibrio saccincola]NLW27800.1 hypothetical protein [Acetivibrio saccincola]PQQ67384.1 hypothetical protein B9R14_11925 [Acetivibrio saccincola]HOA98168.1 hypothetical protein [Acetivibrio saccincola]HQD29394.1 hypothetical protein [Acetivibrio saccincola]